MIPAAYDSLENGRYLRQELECDGRLQNADNRTALLWGIENATVVELLLNHGADVIILKLIDTSWMLLPIVLYNQLNCCWNTVPTRCN